MKQPFILKPKMDRVIRGDVIGGVSSDLRPVIILCHGYKGFKDWGMFPYIAEQLSSVAHVVMFNFSHNGVGENPQEYTELDKFARNSFACELEDLDIVVEAVQNGQILLPKRSSADLKAKRPVFLLGHSRGGGVALLYAVENPEAISAVVSWNGITSFKGLFSAEQVAEMREKGRSSVWNGRTKQNMPLDRIILDDLEQNADRYQLLERIKETRFPVALIQGSEDFDKLKRGSELLIEARPDISHIQVKNGDHTFGSRHPFEGTTIELEEAIRLTIHFIEQHDK